jgi:GH24 family phage-related lysozyme (muramidase)
MWQSVIDSFTDFSVKFEGKVPHLYLDIKGLVTCGVGNLVDPVEAALPLPWVLPDGSHPSASEIAAQWRALKSRRDLAKLHYRYAAAITTMRLTEDGIAQLVRSKLLSNEKVLRGYFPNWDLFSADAQLGISSMSWALGPGFPATFGNFKAAAVAQNWTGAVASCKIREDNNPGLVPRNAANRLCFANAQQVLSQGIPLDTLFWPGTAPSASQRDEALRSEADIAAKEHAEHNARAWDALTIRLRDDLDLTRRDEDSEPPTDPNVV